MNKQVFLLEGSGKLFKANSPDGGQHCYFKFLTAVICCYGSSGDLHLLQPNNAQNVTAEALRNLSRDAERLGDTFMIQNLDASI